MPETRAAELLDAAARTLTETVAPHISGEARFRVLMAASAVRMVMREMQLSAELAAASGTLGGTDQRALVTAIRAGRHDADAALHARLVADAEVRTRVSRPDAV